MPGYTRVDVTAKKIWEYATRRLTNLPDARAARIDKIVTLKENSVNSVSPTGNTAETLIEVTDSLIELSGWIDLSDMEALDDVFIRVYGRVEEGGSWILNAEEEYINAQARPLIYILAKKVNYGVSIILQQVGGTYDNTYRYNFLKEETA